MEHKEYETKSGKPIRLWQGDCMELIEKNNMWDLAVCDPPYGIGESGGDKNRNRGYKRIVKHDKKEWDDKAPDSKYFDKLRMVSNNQCIFGANYYPQNLKRSMGWIVWDKKIGGDFSDGELIYTSFNKALRIYKKSYHHDTKGGHTRIHPTQKPIDVYRYILRNYAEPNDTILDTHGGSMSLAIACYIEDFELDIIELDKDYYNDAVERFEQHISQKTLF